MGENARKNPRAKVLSMTVRYRSATLGEFIEHHSYDVSNGGMFIKTPSPFPPGTLLKFEVKIAEDQRVMQGVGRVVWKRDENGPTHDDPAGMGIKFIKIDEASKAVIERLLEQRGEFTTGAYDKAPDELPKRMFPDTTRASQPPVEDRTVMKPANELLEEALKKTGEQPTSKHQELQNEPLSPLDIDDTEATSEDATEERAQDVRSKSSTPGKSRSAKMSRAEKKAASKQVERSAEKDKLHRDQVPASPEEVSSAPEVKAPAGATREEEGGGGRALITLLVALVVAAGIYLATKNSNPKEASEPSVENVEQAPPPPAPEPAPLPEPAPAPQPEVDTTVVEDDMEAAIEEKAVEEEPLQAEESTPRPAPRPQPRPRVVAPAPEPEPIPEVAPNPEPTPFPATTPTPEPAPAPAPVE